MAKVYRLGPLSFPYAGRPRDVLRGALTGATLFGLAGAIMAKRWGMAAYGLGGDGAGATVQESFGPEWPVGVAMGLAIGAALGAFIVFVAGAAYEERGSAAGIIVVGALCGGAFAATWGIDTARQRIVTVRAVPPGTTSSPPEWKPFFTVANDDVHLSGMIERKVNVPLLAFLVVGGTVVGALAGRGLVGAWPAGERYAAPTEGTFEVGPPLAASHAPALDLIVPKPASPGPAPRRSP